MNRKENKFNSVSLSLEVKGLKGNNMVNGLYLIMTNNSQYATYKPANKQLVNVGYVNPKLKFYQNKNR